MKAENVVSQEQWLEARLDLLAQEKAFDRQRDALTRARQKMPWVKVETDYVFDGPNGKESLSDLFDGRSQLIVYHFMYHPSWGDQPCRSCSFWADNFEGIGVHLNARDVNLVIVSKAKYSQIEAYKRRMGWTFKWVSSYENTFNRDFHVSFTDAEVTDENGYYNYKRQRVPREEMPGMSVFAKDDAGNVFHTYSSYGRGIDMINGAYHLLDRVPKGRDEGDLPWVQAWIRRHDEYGRE
jgi:predicted dithiol-disulfide oxidoreductase (DUF899 family)